MTLAWLIAAAEHDSRRKLEAMHVLKQPLCRPTTRELWTQIDALVPANQVVPLTAGECFLVGVDGAMGVLLRATWDESSLPVPLDGTATNAAEQALYWAGRYAPFGRDRAVFLGAPRWRAKAVAPEHANPSKLDDDSYGLALHLAAISLATGAPLDATVVALGKVTGDGKVGDVGGLEAKAGVLADYALATQTLLVAPDQEKKWNELLRGRDITIVPTGSVLEATEHAFAATTDWATLRLEAGKKGSRWGFRQREQAPRGLPAYRRIAENTGEPMTTRRGAAEKWRGLITQRACEPGSAIIVEAPPGWGKSAFLNLALEGLQVPMQFVGLSHCSSGRHVAQAVVHGATGSEDQRIALDDDPVSCARILSDWLGSPGIVVFEDIHRTVQGKPPAELARIIGDLQALGHLVVVEGWTSTPECVARIPQGKLSICGQAELEKLSMEEVREWAKSHVGRDLTPGEEQTLHLFDGHPFALRQALDLLRSRFRHPDPSAEDELLEIFMRWDGAQTELLALLSNAVRPGDDDTQFLTDMELSAWFGLLPWARPSREHLSEPSRKALGRLLDVGFVLDGDRGFQPGPWARILGLIRCLGEPALSEGAIALLREIVTTVSLEDMQAQRRHLLQLSTRIPQAREFLVFIENKCAPQSVPMVADDDLTYEAPADAEIIACELTSSDPTITVLPPGEQFWLFESAGRLNESASVEKFLEVLQSPAGAVARAALQREWWAAKALHRGLLQLRLPLGRKVELYRRACALVPDQLSDLSITYGVWLTRLLTAAAELALRFRAREDASSWLARAEGVRNQMPMPESGTFERSLYDDTVYRIAAARAMTAPNVGALVAAHLKALDTIPPMADWSANRISLWSAREIRHSRVALSAGALGVELGQRFVAAHARLPVDVRWLRGIASFVRGPTATTTLSRDLRDLVHERLGDPSNALPGRRELARLAALVLDPDLHLAHAEAWATEAKPGLLRASPESIALVSRAVSVMGYEASFEGNSFEKVYRFSDDIAAHVRDLLAEPSTDEWLQRLHMQCLAAIAGKHVIGTARGSAERAPVERIRALGVAERKVDGLYKAHWVAGASPWLLDEWCEWKITCAKQRLAIERQRDKKDLAGDEAAATLERFRQECRKLAGDHPVADAISIRIDRYLWEFTRMRLHLRNLVAASADLDDRKRIADIGMEALSALVLMPPLLRSKEDTCNEAEVRLFDETLMEVALTADGDTARSWIDLTREALLPSSDTTFWRGVVEKGQVFGPIDHHWHDLVSDAQAPESVGASERLDALTDLRVLAGAARLFRFGAGHEVLPSDLRLELGELAIKATHCANAWHDSIYGHSAMLARWHLGISIGLALAASTGGVVLGNLSSPLRTRRRDHPLSWVDAMDRELNAASSSAVGRFGRRSREIWEKLRELTGRPPLKGAHQRGRA